MTEMWTPLVGFEGAYEISDAGRIRGLDRVDTLGRKVNGRLITNARTGPRRKTGGNYSRVRLRMGGQLHNATVHLLVLTSFVGPRPEGMDACHNDGDRDNNALSNLRWDTRSANQRDKLRHGTMASGARNGSAKITEADALAIMAERDASPTALGRKFGVSATQIKRIWRGQSWAYTARKLIGE